MSSRLSAVLLFLIVCASGALAELPRTGLFARTNLVAWCIVPFDSRKRGPEERAGMLERLGIRQLAYDWRAEHIPTFDAEVEAMSAHGITISAWWFPAALNAEARAILACIERKRIHPQLWVTMGTEPEPDATRLEGKIQEAVRTLGPICAEARRLGCTVALYNHLGWFGEPANQVRILEQLRAAGHANAGIVYNFHHAHSHIDDFAAAFKTLQPHLLALNLNGMVWNGDQIGKKIIPLGTGEEELHLLRIVNASGWRGPIGLIGHTEEDAEVKLRKELTGLERLAPQALEAPTPRPARAIPTAARAAGLPAKQGAFVEGRNGRALDARVGGLVADAVPGVRQFPLTVDAWVRLTGAAGFNILVASEAKESRTHWELYTYAGDGTLSLYQPGAVPAEIRSPAALCDGQWHHVGAVLQRTEAALFVDGREVARQKFDRPWEPVGAARVAVGRLVEGGLGCEGWIDDVRLRSGVHTLGAGSGPEKNAGEAVLARWTFESASEEKPLKQPAVGESRTVRSQPVATASGRKAGEPAVSGREPGSQKEADWADNRWQQTDVGPMLTATLRMPDGATVTRALAIRMPGTPTSAVAYDLSDMSFRAAWRGGFIQFDPTRFGLIGTPRAGGAQALAVQPLSTWADAKPRLAAIHRPNAEDVILEYWVNGTRVLEHPTRIPSPVGDVWVRRFEVGAHTNALRFQGAPHLKGGKVDVHDEEKVGQERRSAHVVRVEDGDRVTAMACVGIREVSSVSSDNKKTVDQIELPPRTTPTEFTVFLWEGTVADSARFKEWALKDAVAGSVSSALEPRPVRPDVVTTRGQRGLDTEILAVDTLTLPYENPHNALLFASGVDIGREGELYVSTIHGDVWRVTGVDADLKELKWNRFATGLYQPLGLKVVNGGVFVLGRDRITRLEDRNGDGVADRYTTHFDGIQTSPGGHDYVTCLEADAMGRLYYADPQGVHRVEADGSRMETLATGFRNPNGMGVRPSSVVVTVSPQQGTWTPSSGIWEIHPGLYGGFGGPRVTDERPLGYDAPLCWIPHGTDNSSGSQVWVPSHRWGPLAGLPLHLLWGRCGMMLVLRDTDAAGRGVNGAVVPLPVKFLSGPNRGTFDERDGSLYVAGSTGWQTSAVKDGAVQRVRYTGRPVPMPVGWKVVSKGVELRFAQALDRSAAEDPGSYAVRAWNYRYSGDYGSKDWSVADPKKEGRDEWTVKSARLREGGRTVTLEIPDLRPVMQGELKYNLSGAGGAPGLRGSLWFTVNRAP